MSHATRNTRVWAVMCFVAVVFAMLECPTVSFFLAVGLSRSLRA